MDFTAPELNSRNGSGRGSSRRSASARHAEPHLVPTLDASRPDALGLFAAPCVSPVASLLEADSTRTGPPDAVRGTSTGPPALSFVPAPWQTAAAPWGRSFPAPAAGSSASPHAAPVITSRSARREITRPAPQRLKVHRPKGSAGVRPGSSVLVSSQFPAGGSLRPDVGGRLARAARVSTRRSGAAKASVSVAPAASNTRAQTPDLSTIPFRDLAKDAGLVAASWVSRADAVTSCVDWLEGKFSVDPDEFDSLLDLFSRGRDGGVLPWVVEEHKRSGHPLYSRGHVRLYYVPGGSESRSDVEGFASERGRAYLTITGQGCRELEGDGVVLNWEELAGELHARQFDCSRFDVAYDDRAGVLPFATLKRRVEAAAKSWGDRSFTTRAQVVGGQWSGGADRPFGYTLNVGARGSETFVRFYDKAAQLKAVHDEDIDGSWTRCELEFRRDRANAALLAFAGMRMPTVAEALAGESGPILLEVSGAAAIAGVLRGHLEFKRLGTHSRLERCKVAPWWAVFLAGCEKARLVVRPVVRSVERSLRWIGKQVAVSLGLVLAAEGFGVRALHALAQYGQTRFAKKHQEMLAAHNNNFARSFPSAGAAYGTERGETRRPVARFGGDGSDSAEPWDPSLIPAFGAVENRNDDEVVGAGVYFSPTLGRWFGVGLDAVVA